MKMSETSRRPNVATLGQLIYKSTSGNVSTSRRLNVATSQRPDVSTSRRLNVATSVRVLSFHHLKAKRVQNLGYRETYGLGHGNQNSSDIDLEEEPVICIVYSLWTIELMFYI